MRALADCLVPNLTLPDASILAVTRGASLRERAVHARFVREIPAFHEIEQHPPAQARPWTGRFKVAAFNVERLKDRAGVRGLLSGAGVDVALLSEADLGMARSGNAHTVRSLAGASGEGYLYGVEFLELDLGGADEIRQHAGERNSHGFHGNAIVTGFALERPHLIPLEEGGLWFSGFKSAQRRIGGRMALAARVAGAPKPLWIVGTHLESKTDPADRQAQIQALLRALDRLAPNEACIIGGDFNTKALPRGDGERHLLLEAPERYEPLFADLRRAGFRWAGANLAQPTQGPGPTNKHEPPFGKLDWIVLRGLAAENPQVVAALDAQGRAVSDHHMITVDVGF
ncbi:endonuclease/exonuclease/phosphatase family protein [Microvirga aerilata]|uniref:Endonuclease/exonuclease/phosphatase family protein n=1 Tax=Microvirga aerilata TaxID=670292 RepID=A0A936ZHD2_9HYPH|nr:endonuclease/exonuclease/phosphatase family protein [Microvirga aerilata]MBL0407074.1 endonuclease/exonuclease/phosphatase family protein [Microvirga aerilata]